MPTPKKIEMRRPELHINGLTVEQVNDLAEPALMIADALGINKYIISDTNHQTTGRAPGVYITIERK